MAGRMTFAVRTHGDPMAILPAVRRVVAEAGPELPVFDARTMAEQADQSILRERQLALLATGFGASALLLACVGLYGVLSYAVHRRSREIGIRLALGAAPARVLRMVLWQATLPTASGCLVGLAAALATARLVSGMLFGIVPWDPVALAAATALLVATAMLAACLPARRAARTDPMEVLRYE
jgi:ABC-type antimicrobial peptide transport system permease subunit